MKTLGLAGILLVAAACVTGCGGGSSARPSNLASTVAITTSSPSDISADALIRFVLHFDKNGCPTTGEREGSVVWPHGYTAGVTKQGVHVVVTAAGTEIRAGDAISSGGGVGMASGKAPCVTAGQQTTYVDGDVKVIRAGR